MSVRDAVIVSTARTPIGRANKGSLTECRPDDLAGFIVKTVLEKTPQLDPQLVDASQHIACDPQGLEVAASDANF